MASNATIGAFPTLRSVLLYGSWPFVKLAHIVATILSPFWKFIRFVLLPVTVLVQGILNIVLFPFRLDILDNIEALYKYISVACLIGFVVGGSLYIASNVLFSVLGIDAAAETKAREKQRTLAVFRAERSKQKEGVLHATPILRGGGRLRSRQGLTPQTVFEEDDSEF